MIKYSNCLSVPDMFRLTLPFSSNLVATDDRISFFLMAEQYFTMLIYYCPFCIPSQGHLGWFCASTTVSSAAVKVGVQVSLTERFHFLWTYKVTKNFVKSMLQKKKKTKNLSMDFNFFGLESLYLLIYFSLNFLRYTQTPNSGIFEIFDSSTFSFREPPYCIS